MSALHAMNEDTIKTALGARCWFLPSFVGHMASSSSPWQAGAMGLPPRTRRCTARRHSRRRVLARRSRYPSPQASRRSCLPPHGRRHSFSLRTAADACTRARRRVLAAALARACHRKAAGARARRRTAADARARVRRRCLLPCSLALAAARSQALVLAAARPQTLALASSCQRRLEPIRCHHRIMQEREPERKRMGKKRG